jgi:threonine/homoserine/homoserine lactone efflux protein
MEALDDLVKGGLLGFIVALPPGPNTAMCLRLACRGVVAAAPLIITAALTDATYAAVSVGGLLAAPAVGVTVLLRWLSPGFLLLSAILLWPSRRGAPRSRAVIAITALNPATGAVWLGLSTTTLASSKPGAALLLLPVGAGLATAGWLTALAAVYTRVGPICSSSGRGHVVAKCMSLALLAAAVVEVGGLFWAS